MSKGSIEKLVEKVVDISLEILHNLIYREVQGARNSQYRNFRY